MHKFYSQYYKNYYRSKKIFLKSIKRLNGRPLSPNDTDTLAADYFKAKGAFVKAKKLYYLIEFGNERGDVPDWLKDRR